MPEWVSTFPGYAQIARQSKKIAGRILQTGPVPRHVGVIMDGNRRYAKNHKIELKEGHSLGFETMSLMLELLYDSGIECCTVYAFSIENFKRLKFEVEWLMDLAKLKLQQMAQHGDLCEQYGIRIRILGNRALLPLDVCEILEKAEKMTRGNSRAVLNVCFPYTARDEMASGIRRVIESGEQITEESLEQHLYTAQLPPLDLLVRTSGTLRLSDFLLWQTVLPACRIVFSDKLWPEFSPWDMLRILLAWSFNAYWYGPQGDSL